MSLYESGECKDRPSADVIRSTSVKPFLLANTSDCWFHCDSKAVFLADSAGAVIESNSSAKAIAADGRIVHLQQGKLMFANVRADQLFRSNLLSLRTLTSRHASFLVQDLLEDWHRVDLDVVAGRHNQVFVSLRGIQGTDQRRLADLSHAGLTPSELKIIQRLLDDLPPKEVARDLRLSERTIRTHLRNIYLKLNVRGLTSAIRKTSELIM